MSSHSLALACRARATQFARIGAGPWPFQELQSWKGEGGIAWAGKRLGDYGLAFTWLGPGWVFDTYASNCRAEELTDRRRKMQVANDHTHRRELNRVLQSVRLGRQSERLLWAIHRRLLFNRRSVLHLADFELAKALWGPDPSKRPLHWRQNLFGLLDGLSWLHIVDWSDDALPSPGKETAILTHVGDLRGCPGDACNPDCPGYPDRRHHHYLVNVGRGFLGVLEAFAEADDDVGVRTYSFPRGGPKSKGPSLWRVGKSGGLVSIFLPAKLGDPAVCATLRPGHHRILQALVRETTRTKVPDKGMTEAEVFVGNLVPSFAGKQSIACPLLSTAGRYVGFNGNRRRKGRGYRLMTAGGWLAKAGYATDEVQEFLNDLTILAKPLGIITSGISRGHEHFDLDRMTTLAASTSGRHILDRLHVRFYSGADYLDCWTTYFLGGEESGQVSDPNRGETVEEIQAALKSKKISGRVLAAGIGLDHSFLAKVLNGKKPCPSGLVQKSKDWLEKQKIPGSKPRRPARASSRGRPERTRTILEAALDLHDRGWCIVPQLPGKKMPVVKWKPYQNQQSTVEELTEWFERWPNAGLALVLGPVSDVFVIDVDGPEAHEALMTRLGREPKTLKALSGGRKPHRYHLFFRHPDLPTKAKQTPWHKNLEFRGQGGIVIVPPSLHKSGNRYEWVPGYSPDDLDLPAVPPAVLEALKPCRLARRSPRSVPQGKIPQGLDASPRTLAFLSGQHADGPEWNARLFIAACDLHGRGMPKEKAELLLLTGASPWNAGEEENARRTIHSAFAQQREPSHL